MIHKSEYDSFISNPAWKEIVETISGSMQLIDNDLRTIDPLTDGTALARQQGRYAMASEILRMPEGILEEIETIADKGEKGR
jgi:hypothetical protein